MANLLKIQEYISEQIKKSTAKTLREHSAQYVFSAFSESVDNINPIQEKERITDILINSVK